MQKEITDKDIKKIHKILGIKEGEKRMCVIFAETKEGHVMGAIQGNRDKVIKTMLHTVEEVTTGGRNEHPLMSALESFLGRHQDEE